MTLRDRWGFLYHRGVVNVSANNNNINVRSNEASVQAYAQVSVTNFVPAPD